MRERQFKNIPGFLPIKEFAIRYGCCVDAVYKWIKRGLVEAIYLGQRRIYVREVNPTSIGYVPRTYHTVDDFPAMRGNEVAVILGVDPRRVRKIAAILEVGRLSVGGKRRYSIQDVRKIIAYRMDPKKHKGPQIRAAVIEWARQRIGPDLVAASQNRKKKPLQVQPSSG